MRKAVADIFAGKTFDYGTICSSEQAIVTEESVRERRPGRMPHAGRLFSFAGRNRKRRFARFSRRLAHPEHADRRTPRDNDRRNGRDQSAGLDARADRAPRSAVGREFPLSAEKLSPILAFYSVPNLAAGIALCRRLLNSAAPGHTCAIHSQNRPAMLEFGQAMPAFRVVVNSASVHGSIGYSTNLFPAMTLGCGAPGGNITSDNIGPQHLMNVKRIAWESRGVEHRTVPADQRLSAVSVPTPAPARAAAAAASSSASPSVSHAASVVPSVAPTANAGDVQPAVPNAPQLRSAISATLAAAAATAPAPDRATIARIVEQVFTSRGIPRRGPSPSAAPGVSPVAAPAISSPPSFAASAKGSDFAAAPPTSPVAAPAVATAPPPPPAPAHPLPPPVDVAEFLSENDVRIALTRNLKLYIGPKTILTPSASDLGREHDIFIVTDIVPAPKKRRFES